MSLTEERRAERLPSGVQYVYKNRSGWAHDRLKRAQLSGSPKYGFWKLTESGLKYAKDNSFGLTPEKISELALVAKDVRLTVPTDSGSQSDSSLDSSAAPQTPTVESPDDRLDSALDNGIISLDRLGLEKVYVQAKRWQNTVGRPEIQGFYGALAGQRANKGVFITTSTFTAQAVAFANSVERIVLVDGERLTALMSEHGVGVSHRPTRIPKIDSDYFDE